MMFGWEVPAGALEKNTLNNRLLDVLMTHMPIGVCCLDLELRYLYINDNLAKLNGIPANAHIGKHIKEIVPTLLITAQLVANQVLLEGEPVEDYVFCGESPLQPGIIGYWSESWYPIRNDVDEIVAFAVIVKEITEQKKAEKEIRDREERLVGVNQILHAALSCETEKELGLICLGVIKKITGSRVGFINEYMGNGLAIIAISHPGWDACRFLEASEHISPKGTFKIHGIYGRVISDGKGLFTNDPKNHPDSVGLPENHPPLSSFLGVPMLHEGRIFGILAVGNREGGYSQAEQDLLEALSPAVVEAFMRKRANDELEALNHQLELRVEQRTRELQEAQSQQLHSEKLAAIGQLSASFAHEFNSPLMAVMTVLKIMEMSSPLKGEEKKLLDAAIDESKRMKNLISSLQDFNRPSSGKKVLMDVHAAMDAVLVLLNIDFRRKKILISLGYDKKIPQILAIPDQIKQVFLNLLNNAADACPCGGVILITTWQEGDRVAVSIQDTGIGIEPENLEKIFRPFYTTKPVVKGTGLGLSVCHGIVQSHGGRICVESDPEAGSTFTVYLPIKHAPEIPIVPPVHFKGRR